MNVLIFGHQGWIGGMMCNLLEENNIDYVTSSVRANDKNKNMTILKGNINFSDYASRYDNTPIEDKKQNESLTKCVSEAKK